MGKNYKHQTSGYHQWKQKDHAHEYMLYPENMGTHLSIDEVALSKGELYTFVTNKAGKGKKGTLVACIEGTKAVDITKVLIKLPLEARNKVKEVTLDMARNMEKGVRDSFPNTTLVTDRFHVVKLVLAALQHLRIKYRWEEINIENEAILKAKKKGEKYIHHVFQNGDTPKQLLARSRYILAKKQSEWTINQEVRAFILFDKYPILEKAYHHVMAFRNIYEDNKVKDARGRFFTWIKKSEDMKLKDFTSAANSVNHHLDNILNFFINRNTNANAESFNAKLKLFRANLRGVSDTTFFLFRLANLFA